MADAAAVLEEGVSPAQSPLVAVTFQKNIHRKEKYLEAEPKALGITQISLSLFKVICILVLFKTDPKWQHIDIPFVIFSFLVVIAGSVAVAAQNLHLSTLKSCLGLQIVACGVSIFNAICTLIKLEDRPRSCWYYPYDNSTYNYCYKIESINSHFCAGGVLIQATLFAISATLAAYCCKVINCCGPPPKMPVITIQVPPVQE